MKHIVFIISFFIVALSHGQNKYDKAKISSKIKTVVEKISQQNRLTGEYIGYAGSKSTQYENFEELKNASTDELISLTNHPNGVVRCYAFWTLGFKSNVDLFEIVKNHLNDNEIIEYQSGCIISSEKVGDFYISLVTPEYVDLDVKKLNDLERKTLDSLLIYQENELNARHTAIELAEPTPQLYPILRKLYVTNHNQSALLKLSTYKREEDIPLILANREDDEDKESGYFFTYGAIQNFPRKEFIPFLEARLQETLDERHYSQEWRKLYSAIAVYKNQKALELLKIPFTHVTHDHIKKYHLDFIYDAILETPDPLYAELLWELWGQDQEITLTGYRFYLQNDINRGYTMTVKKLGGQKMGTNILPIFNESIFTDNLEESMLNLIILNDKKLAHQIIESKILDANVHEFPIYTSVIRKNKDKSFVESLFKRFGKEWNAHVYLEIAKTLIEFEDKAINDRIIVTRKNNKKLNENWGGEALTKLLKEKNIK
ncbi:hypothetical protein [Flavobacterium soli]|uniref:hypothetical protein n=1 Tax=Flavobacterium soli TaxID=344881 RepID=UPI0003FC85A6|nr:hypothetical protein [Flavobacterium soli]